ncbi:MAG: VCBS repeat-containing protein [Phycisphaerales bacterium]|nr:VCBS repeat-containing protein [Phycisphaerales bacterium]
MAHLRTNGLFRNGLIATTGALALATASSAEFDQLVGQATVVDQTGWSATDPRPLILVSVYATFTEATDQLISVYGDSLVPLSIITTDNDGFYQFNAAGAQAYSVCNTSQGINTALPFSSQTSDSFVTIGFTSSAEGKEINALQHIGVDFASFNPPSDPAEVTSENGAWFCTPDDFQTVAGNFGNEILIGQFTVAAGETVSGTVNLQWRDFLGNTTYTAQSFSADAVVESVRGDLDGDGFADITLQRDDNQRLWALMGSAIGLSTQDLGSPNLAGFTALGVGDVTGNQRSDMVIQRDDKLVLGYMAWNGSNLKYNLIKKSNLSDWTFVDLGDINGDGILDLVFQKTSGSNAYQRIGAYIMGGATASWQTLPPNSSLANWTLLGCADLTGDGIDDIVLQKTSGGNALERLGYFRCTAPGGIVATSYVALTDNNLTGWSHFGFGNFDNSANGEDDIFFRKDTDNKIRAYWGDSGNRTTYNTFTFNAWDLLGGAALDGGDEADVILMQKIGGSEFATFTRDGVNLDFNSVNSGNWAGFKVEGF